MSENNPIESAKPTSDELDRMWQHGMHEENTLNDRLNFFLVLESVLLGVVAMLLSQSNPPTNRDFMLRALLTLGLALTVIWAYVAARQKYIFDLLRKRLRENLPEYAETRRIREQGRWPISDISLLSYVVPTLFILIWIALQFAV